MSTKTVNVDVEIDLSVFDAADLLAELDDETLRAEYESRTGVDLDERLSFSDLLDQAAIMQWLREANPPKDVRDLVYQSKGVIV